MRKKSCIKSLCPLTARGKGGGRGRGGANAFFLRAPYLVREKKINTNRLLNFLSCNYFTTLLLFYYSDKKLGAM